MGLSKEQVCMMTGFKMPYDPNPVQAAAFTPIFMTDANVFAFALTGSGKTLIYEWAMWKALKSGQHVVVLAPNKALVEQKAEAWCKESHTFRGIKTVVKTGDYHDISSDSLVRCPIKILTPEAFAVALRGEKSRIWTDLVSCLVVDEIHTLGSAGRGNGLEACVIDFFNRNKGRARMIGASATVDEDSIKHIAGWVRGISGLESHVINSPHWRPTPLVKHWIPYHHSRNYKKAESEKLFGAANLISNILQVRGRVLAFVHTKKFGRDLTDAIPGAMFHCADSSRIERAKMESMFASGQLRILVATSTLAAGMDFPVEDVVICGFHRGLNEVEKDTIQQMQGRSGHQADCTEGRVYYLYPEGQQETWERYLQEQYSVVSDLHLQKWASFHLISIVVRSNPATDRDLNSWYNKTLASVQKSDERFNNTHIEGCSLPFTGVENTIEDLLEVQAVRRGGETEIPELDGYTEAVLYPTILGKAATYFYFDPQDVYGWWKNLPRLSKRSHAMASYILSKGLTLCSLIPREFKPDGVTVTAFDQEMQTMGFDVPTRVSDFTFFFFQLSRLSGNRFSERDNLSNAIKASMYTIDKELRRICACLSYICKSRDLNLVQLGYLEDTIHKIIYGVDDDMLELVRIPNIGRASAQKLHAAGISNFIDILRSPEEVLKTLGRFRGQKVIDAAEASETVSFDDYLSTITEFGAMATSTNNSPSVTDAVEDGIITE